MQLDNFLYFKNSSSMPEIEDCSVDLVVTSPPYPMIKMWDDIFTGMTQEAGKALSEEKGPAAFEYMHKALDSVWAECYRVMKPGSFACINIGDAARRIGNEFRLFPNHSRITQTMLDLGCDCLPIIHWFKPTNSPTKFMGSGMLPSGAYVTLEHEYILIFRKGGKRKFSESEGELRRQSAFFWEERNKWFSDVWDFKGESQPLKRAGTESKGRDRSGAFPYELPFRLINMYSMQTDTVLDPFSGTGTTFAAAVVNGRRFLGYEIDNSLTEQTESKLHEFANRASELVSNRLDSHRNFIIGYSQAKGQPKYLSRFYGFPVITSQEKDIIFPELEDLEINGMINTDSCNTLNMTGIYKYPSVGL